MNSMDQADRGRTSAAAWVAAAVLVAVSVARWRGFVYPNYLGGVLFQCGVLALLLVWSWRRNLPSAGTFAGSLTTGLLGAYALVLVASCLWAPTPRLAVIGSIPVLFCVTWALALGHLLRDRGDIQLVASAVFLAGVMAALFGLYYVIRSGSLDATEFVQGHRNFLAIFLLPPVLLGAADLLSPAIVPGASRGNVLGLHAVVAALGVLIMLVALVMCRSVGGVLGLLAGLLCLCAARLSPRKRLALVATVIGLAVVGAVVLSLPSTLNRLLASHPSQATRWFLWQGTLRMILDRPLLGWGAGMFMPHFADYKPIEPMRLGLLTDLTIYPHNELLLVTVEGGLIALALYVGGLLSVARRHLRATELNVSAGTEAPDRDRRVLAWAVLAGFAAMSAQGLVSVALRFWAPSALYWTLVGMILAFPGMSRVSPAPTQRRRWSAAVILKVVLTPIAVLLAAWGVVWPGAVGERLMGRVAEAVKKGRATTRECVEMHMEAARLSRYVPDYFIALRRRAAALGRMGDLDGAIAAHEQIEEQAPGYGPTRRLLGELYLQRAKKLGAANSTAAIADLKKAADVLGRAVKQNPFSSRAHLLRADVALLLSAKNLPVALEHVRAAVKADPENPQADFALGMLLARTGDKEGALAALDRALALCTAEQTDLATRIERLKAEIIKKKAR